MRPYSELDADKSSIAFQLKIFVGERVNSGDNADDNGG